LLISSSKYKRRSEGRAINIKIIAGIIVQIISINWTDNKNRLVNLLKNNIVSKYDTNVVIIIRINKE